MTEDTAPETVAAQFRRFVTEQTEQEIRRLREAADLVIAHVEAQQGTQAALDSLPHGAAFLAAAPLVLPHGESFSPPTSVEGQVHLGTQWRVELRPWPLRSADVPLIPKGDYTLIVAVVPTAKPEPEPEDDAP